MQPNFVMEMLQGLKENGISTAVDTSGYTSFEHLKRTAPYVDCFLYDMKYGKNIGVRKLRPFFIMMATYLMNKYVRHKDLVADTVKVAFKDAVAGRTGKTVEPGKLEEYLEKRK